MATIDLLEETANYLLNHCFVLGGVEEQRAKYLYIQDHLNEVRAVFKPLGYAVLLYPAPMQAAALVNEHEGSQARLLKYESILLLVLRLLYLQKRESLAASADEVLVTVEEVQAELQKMNLPRKLDQQTLEKLMRTLRRYNLARPVGRLSGLDSRIEVFPTVLLALPGMGLAGTVRNVIDFGAFVDIGVHQDGLVHISQISSRFIRHPSEVLKVGDVVTVWVLSVDLQKKRIALTMKQPKTEQAH